MKHIELLIFDLDGTLINSGEDIATSVNHTLKTLGIPIKKSDEIISFVGDGIQTLLERCLGKDFHYFINDALGIFSAYYAEHMLDTTKLYDSVIQIMEHFHGTRKVVITNKRQSFTEKITDSLGISKYFDQIIGSDSTAYKKPDPRLLLPLIEKYGVFGHTTVVIGDGVNDIMLAKQAGTLSCALLNGLTKRDRLLDLHPDFAFEGLSELTAIFM